MSVEILTSNFMKTLPIVELLRAEGRGGRQTDMANLIGSLLQRFFMKTQTKLTRV
jgi:hypothetical protein